jgi:hypothetical protein
MSRPASTASGECSREGDISFLTRLLFAGYFLEAGLILIIAPWSAFWDDNTLLAAVPWVEGVLLSPYARGAVSGVGGVTALAGLFELASAIAARYRSRSESPHPESRGCPSDRTGP